MSNLERIIANGDMGSVQVKCADGFKFTVLASPAAYCEPRPIPNPFGTGEVPADYAGPYTRVEVGFSKCQPQPEIEWDAYLDKHSPTPARRYYLYVPIEMVRALVALHGGEKE